MKPTLGIIAGGGKLPSHLVEACLASERPCFVLAFDNATDIPAIAHVPHASVRLGAVGEALSHLKNAHVEEVVLAGNVRRPPVASLLPDMAGARLLARMGTAFFAGDDALLKAIIAFLEEEGFRVVGADDVLGELAAPEGLLTKAAPDERMMKDIAQGMEAARALGAHDIGQAAIVESGYILGVEGAEGTDALIGRCGQLRREKNRGVLVKAKKPLQETRADLPAIGPQTMEKLHEAGFAGVAVEAGGAIILDREQAVERADALGLFIIGVK